MYIAWFIQQNHFKYWPMNVKFLCVLFILLRTKLMCGVYVMCPYIHTTFFAPVCSSTYYFHVIIKLNSETLHMTVSPLADTQHKSEINYESFDRKINVHKFTVKVQQCCAPHRTSWSTYYYCSNGCTGVRKLKTMSAEPRLSIILFLQQHMHCRHFVITYASPLWTWKICIFHLKWKKKCFIRISVFN